jgi:hypothetical protein
MKSHPLLGQFVFIVPAIFHVHGTVTVKYFPLVGDVGNVDTRNVKGSGTEFSGIIG